MAVAFVAERYSVGQGASSNDLVSGSFTPGADALLVIVAHVSESITSISGHDGGGSWVQIGSALDVDGRDLEFWACHTGSSPSAGTVTVEIPYNWNIAITLLEFSGVDVSGTVAASFGTPVGTASYDGRVYIVDLAAFSDPGNATLIGVLNTAGTGTPWNVQNFPQQWHTPIGFAGSNGRIGAAWCNFEDDARVQVMANAYSWNGLSAVEIKAATPATVSTRYVGNGMPLVNPAPLIQQCKLIQFTPDVNGTIGSVWAYVQDNNYSTGETFCMYLYDASGNLLDTSNTVDSTDGNEWWAEFTGMTSSLTAGTTYYLGVACDGTFGTRTNSYQANAHYAGYEITSGFSNLASPPDPATITVNGSGLDFTIYAEYAPSAGAAANPKGPFGLPFHGPFAGPIGP